MRIVIYWKDGSYMDDCLIDNISYNPEDDVLKLIDRFGHEYLYSYNKVACIICKGVATYEN